MLGRSGMRCLAPGVCALLLAACGSVQAPPGDAAGEPSSGSAPDPVAATSSAPPGPAGQAPTTEAPGTFSPDDPPTVLVGAGGRWLELDAWTWCLADGCADGMPPDPLPDLGTVDGPVLVDLPEGSQLFASWRSPGDPCGVSIDLPPVVAGPDPVEVLPAGAAGTWQLDVFSRPPGGGDLIASAQVTTTADSPVPDPGLRLTSFFDHDGRVVQYGPVELRAARLAQEAAETGLTAALEVVAADGTTSTIDLEQVDPEGCAAPGSALLRQAGRGQGIGEVEVGDELGPPPYALTLTLTYDGAGHVATATWPDDVDDENSAILLRLEPGLPAAEASTFGP